MRPSGWEMDLALLVREWRDRPFSWGHSDCACLMRAAARAIRGKEIWHSWPEYSCARSARSALRVQGYESLGQALSAQFLPVAPQYAKTGDFIILPGVAFGVGGVLINSQIAQMGPDGLTLSPFEARGRAWRV